VTTAVIIAVAVIGLFLLSSDGGRAGQAAAVAPSADNPYPDDAAGQLLTDSALPALAKMVGALLVVIVCIYLGIYLLKRTIGARYSNSRGTNALEIIETAGLGQRKSVSLVRVGDRSELDAADTAAILATAPEEVETDSFSKMLNAATSGVRRLASKNRRAALET